MTTTERHLRVKADLGELADVRRFVRDAVRAADAPIECLDDLVQAVDEAATNVITHGYDGMPGWIDVGVALAGDRFVVTLEDTAREFDPTKVPEPDLSVPPLGRKPGGMGVHLMRAATDALSHRPRPGGGNILTMVRSRTAGRKEED
ncbi:MAG TPA: ATP-binding protein [Candidatus Limnocylindrales bacterium]|nr:ATP-binding protein [Candidatus Limnocylindrales bacterium]